VYRLAFEAEGIVYIIIKNKHDLYLRPSKIDCDSRFHQNVLLPPLYNFHYSLVIICASEEISEVSLDVYPDLFAQAA